MSSLQLYIDTEKTVARQNYFKTHATRLLCARTPRPLPKQIYKVCMCHYALCVINNDIKDTNFSIIFFLTQVYLL